MTEPQTQPNHKNPSMLDTTEPHRLPSLVDASIHLYWIEDDVTQQLGIFGVLSNVTTLHLLDFDVTVISSS